MIQSTNDLLRAWYQMSGAMWNENRIEMVQHISLLEPSKIYYVIYFRNEVIINCNEWNAIV